MGFLVTTKRSKLFQEFSLDKQKEYFSLTEKKYYPHIDTYYYSVFLKGDSVKDNLPELYGLLNLFADFREEVKKRKEDIYFDKEKDLLYRKTRFKFYEHCLGIPGMYDIFFCSSIPNSSTPRIVVQLRSIGLWSVGEYTLIEDSFSLLNDILDKFGIVIDKVQENRIDYAYHTNIIQNPIKFYGDRCLQDNLVSSMKKYMKVGDINPCRGSRRNRVTVDYLSLGTRRSNCIFFRTYNKVREVVEENYKEFFLKFWRNEGLISFYDFFVYSYAYEHKNYDYIYWGMLDFYLQYGTDEIIKNRFSIIKRDSKKFTIDKLKDFVLEICPMPTLIINIEFQTMRRYYYLGRELIQTLSTCTESKFKSLKPLFQILDNRKIFLKSLTRDTVSFRKKDSDDFMDFWERLRNVKLESTVELDYVRNYKTNINVDVLVSKLKGLVASFAVLSGNLDANFDDDLSATLTYLNDNDFIRKVYDDKVDCKYEAYDYDKIFERKMKALKSMYSNSRPSKVNV